MLDHERYKLSPVTGEGFFWVDSNNLEDDIEYIKKNNIYNISLCDRKDGYLHQDLKMLKSLTTIKKLSINPHSSIAFNYDDLKYFTNLEKLGIANEKADKIDVSHNVKLKECFILNATKLSGLEHLVELEYLKLTKPNKALFNIDIWNALKKLKKLRIARSSLPIDFQFLSNIQIEELDLFMLKGLDFTYVEQLKLAKLEINKCKDVLNSNAIYTASSLKELKIIDSFSVPSAKLITQLPNLDLLAVTGKSTFEDGDLSPLKNKLKYFGFTAKKHYSLTMEEYKENYSRK
jgi:hypothetical protein